MSKYIIKVDTRSRLWKRLYVYLPKKANHDRYIGKDIQEHYVVDKKDARVFTSLAKAEATALPYETIINLNK